MEEFCFKFSLIINLEHSIISYFTNNFTMQIPFFKNFFHSDLHILF